MKHEAFHDEEAMEIAKFLSDYNMKKGSIDERYIPYVTEVGQAMYDEGYRRQREGEWKRSENCKYDYFCTACGVKARFNIYGNHDNLSKFCPNCGARMKGGERE